MKKSWTRTKPLTGITVQKMLIFMKLTCCMLFISFMSLQASVYSQHVKVSVNLKNANLETLFSELSKQANCDFLFNHKLVQSKGKVDVVTEGKTLEEVLNEVLPSIGLRFTFEDNTVIIGEATPAQQQTRKIKGKIVDPMGEPLPGATILIKGTSTGVATDLNGIFQLSLPESEGLVLEVRFIGMETKEIKITDIKDRAVLTGEKEYVITLAEAKQTIDEIVVTGVFDKARESYTGSATTITNMELKEAGNRSILTAIRNIDPSFNILQDINAGSDPNTLPNITIRGNSSLPMSVNDLQETSANEANLPLFIMDGFEISLARFVDLDEQQVESITLLKDASSTALYGTRGANGVIVIASKKPEAGRLRITYRGNLNIEAPDLSSYNLMNSIEKLEFEKAAGLYYSPNANLEFDLSRLYNSRRMNAERGVDTYWLKYPVRTGTGQRHSLRVEGGDNSFRYAMGVSYNNIEATMKGSSRNTLSGNMYFSYNHNNIRFQNDLQVSQTKSQNSPYGKFNDFSTINQYYTPYSDIGEVVKFLENNTYLASVGYVTIKNPLYNASLFQKNESEYLQVTNNLSVEWSILPELSFRGRFSFTTQRDRKDIYKPAGHTDFDDSDYARRGSYSYTTGNSFNYDVNLTLNYSKLFHQKHQLSAGLGYTLRESTSESYTAIGVGIYNPRIDFFGSAAQYEYEGSPKGTEAISRSLGLVLSATYTYNRRYFADFSGKMEGSSKFGADKRFAPFWSAGIGWNLHHEDFLRDNPVLNVARLRLNYGTSGNQSFSSYQALTTFSEYGGVNYRGEFGMRILGLGNPDLQWQTTRQFNVGTEVDLFKGRLQLDFDFYNKITDDLVTDITIQTASGFSSYKANIGKVQNVGVEAKLNAYIIRNREKQLSWLVSGSLAHNKNTIKKISNALKALNESLQKEAGASPSFLYQEGESINTIFVVKSKGIDPSNGRDIFVKKDGTETYTWDANDKVAAGVAEPSIWGNITTTLRYKRFTLNSVFGYRYGGQMYNSTLVNKIENINPYDNADKRAYYDRWKQPGDKAFFKSVTDRTATRASSRFVMDENTLECRSISLGYDFAPNWVKQHLLIDYLSITGYMEDVFHLSSIKLERGLNSPYSHKFSLSLTARF